MLITRICKLNWNTGCG
uniref:Uncharacterized protein n=1 Tax=Rhizophora mucronata TaxID=61149 RepID=A0A2P2Q2B5_RHIMU